MNFAAIDGALDNWARAHSLSLFKEFAGREERFVYISNSRAYTLQIYVLPISNGRYSLNIATVESPDGSEYKNVIEANPEDIPDALEKALLVTKKYLSQKD